MKTKIKTTLALFAAFCGLQLFADAPTPVAVWDGDLANNSTKNGYKVDTNGNTASDGIITIGSKGVKVWLTSPGSGKSTGMTVLYKYTGMSSGKDQALAGFYGSGNGTYAGARLQTSNISKGIKADSDYSGTGTTTAFTTGSGIIAATYKSDNGTYCYHLANGKRTLIYGSDSLKGTDIHPKGANVAGRHDGTAMQGAKISAIAIFESVLTEEEMKAYKFPSDPVVVWDGDFGVTEKTGTDGLTYTLDLQGNTVTDGKLVISSSTVGAKITPSATKNKCSVLIKYSNLGAVSGKKPTLATIHSNSGFDIGLAPHTAGGLAMNGFYNNEATRYGIGQNAATDNTDTLATLPTGTGYFMLTHNKDSGTSGCAGATIAKMASGGKSTKLMWSNNPLCAISIGGPLQSRSSYPAWTNVKIEAVAIFNDQELTAAQIATFQFPSDANDTKRWGNLGTSASDPGACNGSNDGGVYSSFNFNFGVTDNSSISQAQIPGHGKVKIKKIRLVRRTSKTTAAFAITLTQTGGPTVTSSSHTLLTGQTIWWADGTAKTVDIFDVTFTSDSLFDASQNITMTFDGGSKEIYMIKPKNSVLCSGDWSPACEIQGDWYAPTTISLNFGASTTARTVSGDPGAIFADMGWYNTSATSGGTPGLFEGTASLIYSAGSNYGNDNQGKTFNKGYFDDGSKISLTFSNLDNGKYDVVIYCASDNASGWSYKTVNGVNYSWDATTGKAKANSTDNWGSNPTDAATAEPGAHALLIRKLEVTDGTISISSQRNGSTLYRGCVSAVQLAKVYEATVTQDTNWSDLEWSPCKPPAGANVNIINNGTDDTTTLSFDVTANVGMFSVTSPVGKTLKLGSPSKLTANSYDFSEAPGGVGFGVTGGWTVPEALRNYLRDNEAKVIFDSTDSSGATLTYDVAESSSFKSHVVFEGGTHAITWGTGGGGSTAFSTTGTLDNPTLFIKNGTTLNFTMRDMCGWNESLAEGTVVRVENGATMNLLPKDNMTMYMRGRLVFEPGSTTTYKTGTGDFKIYGGDQASSDNTKAQIYVPAPTTANKVATFSKNAQSSKSVAFSKDATAITVAGDATLDFDTPFTGNQEIKKYGTGTLKLLGAVNEYTSKLSTMAGNTVVACGGTVPMNQWIASGSIVEFTGDSDTTASGLIAGAGAVKKTGTATTTLTYANTYSGGTTVEAGTLVVSMANGSYTINGGMLDIRTNRSAGIASIAEGAKLSVKQAATGEDETITITGTSLEAGDYKTRVQVCEKSDDATLMPIKTATVADGTLTITLDRTIFNVEVSSNTTLSEIEKTALGEGKTFEQAAQLTITTTGNPVITVDKSLHITKFAIVGQATLKYAGNYTITAPTISTTATLTFDCADVTAETVLLSGTITGGEYIDKTTGIPEGTILRVSSTEVRLVFKARYQKFNYGTVYSWLTTGSGNVDFTTANSALQVFDIVGCTNKTDVTYNGQTSVGGQVFWKLFAYATGISTTYEAPGEIWRLEPGYCPGIGASYGPFTLGGILAEPGAADYKFEYTSGTRSSLLGDPTDTTPTFFDIFESVTFNRSGDMYLSGTMTFDIADGKTFDLNSAQTSKTLALFKTVEAAGSGAFGTTTPGGTLIMKGAGTLKVAKLKAEGSMLDYSNVSLDRGTAYITGAIQINTDTKFNLPAGLAENTPFKLASSITGAPTETTIRDLSIGGVEAQRAVTFDAANGTIKYLDIKAYTASIGAAGTYQLSTLGWGKTFAPTIYDSATITIADGVTGEVVINMDNADLTIDDIAVVSADNATVRFTGSNPTTINAWDFSGTVGRVTFDFAPDFTKVTKGTYPRLGIGYAYTGTIATGYEYLGTGNTLTLPTSSMSGFDAVMGGSGTFAGSAVDGDFKADSTVVWSGTYTHSNITNYLGMTDGALTIPEGAKVTVSHIRINNDGTTANDATVTVGGKLIVDSTCGSDCYGNRGNYVGILFGHWKGSSSLTVTGEFLATNSWLQTAYTANGANITVDGGTLLVRGLNTSHGDGLTGSAITVQNNGVLSLAEGLKNQNQAASFTFNGGTLKAYSYNSSTGYTWSPATTAVGADGMTIDPNGLAITVSGALTGSGNVTVHDSSAAANGSVAFTGDLSGYQGTITYENGVYDFSTLRALPSKITLNTGVRVTATQTRAEFGQGVAVELSGVPDGIEATITRPDGTTTTVTTSGGKAVFPSAGAKIDQQATLYDITFTNLNDVGKSGSQAGTISYRAVNQGTLQYDNPAVFYTTDPDVVKERGDYIRNHPYLESAASVLNGLNEFTAVLVGKMSATANTIFVFFGSAKYNSSNEYQGLMVVTTPEEDGVAIYSTKTSSSARSITLVQKLTVPNSATTRHVYIITKRDVAATANEEAHSVFTIYLDGTKRAEVKSQGIFTLGRSDHCGMQVGADFGGGIRGYNFGEQGTFNAVPVEETETGVLNVCRLYDYMLSDAQVAALKDEYPYITDGGRYSRDVTGAVNYQAENTWKKNEAQTAEYDVPTGTDTSKPSAKLTATGDGATITVNTNSVIDTFTFKGAAMTFVKDATGTNTIEIATADISAPVTVKYGAIDFVKAAVSLTGGSLTFDMSDFPLANCFTSVTNQMTGMTERKDDSITMTGMPTVAGRTPSFAFNTSDSVYNLIIEVAAAPFVYTVADAEPGQWSFHGVDCDEPTDWTKVNSTQIQKAGAGTGTIARHAGFTYSVTAGTLVLESTGDYGTVAISAGAALDVGTRRDVTVSGEGGVKAQLETDPQPGDAVTLFAVASGTPTVAELKKSDGTVIDPSYYTYANGVVTFKKEAKIGTQYYFTLRQAIEDTSATEVELVADIAEAEEITVSRAISFDGGTNILSNVTFTFNGGTLTLNTGCIGIGYTAGMTLSGGCCRFTETSKATWDVEGIRPSGYEIATLSAAVRPNYVYEFIKSSFKPGEGEQLVPVMDQNKNDAGAIKLNSAWVVTATGGETDPQEQAKILNNKQNNKLMTWQNKILGLDGDDPDAKPVVHFSQSQSEAGKIAFTLNGVAAGSGANVKFDVYSAATPGATSWDKETQTPVASGSTAEVTLPTQGVRYYRYDVITETSK